MFRDRVMNALRPANSDMRTEEADDKQVETVTLLCNRHGERRMITVQQSHAGVQPEKSRPQ